MGLMDAIACVLGLTPMMCGVLCLSVERLDAQPC